MHSGDILHINICLNIDPTHIVNVNHFNAQHHVPKMCMMQVVQVQPRKNTEKKIQVVLYLCTAERKKRPGKKEKSGPL